MSAVGAESYEWNKDGKNITDTKYNIIGTDKPNLTINEFLADDQGHYVCVVKNSHRSIESMPANLALGKCQCQLYSCIWLHQLFI